MIKMNEIRKTYKMGETSVHALDGISLHIEPREFVAIIGPSGSGKSTLMNIIGCLDSADEGVYMLDGQDITTYTERQLSAVRNKKIGFIFQQFNLLQKLTALQNVELPLIYQGVNAKTRSEWAEEALERVGLSDRMHHRPNELSGGQQQRVAIARALGTKPSLILADEPTGNLDSKSGVEIMKMLHELHDAGNTIVLITHDNQIADEADRRIRVSDGKIVLDERSKKSTFQQASVTVTQINTMEPLENITAKPSDEPETAEESDIFDKWKPSEISEDDPSGASSDSESLSFNEAESEFIQAQPARRDSVEAYTSV